MTKRVQRPYKPMGGSRPGSGRKPVAWQSRLESAEAFDCGHETPCLFLPKKPEPNGYARIGTKSAHRVFYEMLVGPIPESLQIDHLCRQRACVNTQHMEPVSIKENVLRGAGLTAKAARQTHCKYGHPLSGDNVKTWPSRPARRACIECRRRLSRECQRNRRLRNAD